MPWNNQSGSGGPWGSGSRGPWGSGPQQPGGGSRPPDLEEFLRRSQDRLRGMLPGNLGGRGIALIALAAIVLWGFSGFFRVEPDELGVVLRFGKFVREVQPGLNYHLPYPIETALTPPALRVNKTDVGIRPVEDVGRRTSVRELPEESLMLTGDENIVDVDFSVLWRVKPNHVADYLFDVQNPEGTVKAVAESAMRQVIGRSNVQRLLTGGGGSKKPLDAQSDVETSVRELMQKTLDSYGAGILVQNVQLQKVNPPPRSWIPSSTFRRRAPIPNARRTRRKPMPIASFRRRAAAPPRSPRTPKRIVSRLSPKPRARLRASCRSTTNTRKHPT